MLVRYGSHPEQVGDLYVAEKGQNPHRHVVLWHGGAFQARHTRAMLAPLAQELARRGFTVYNATYRRKDAGGGPDETFADALAAVDALELSEPPAGIGLSAGAALALHAALEGRLSRVVDISGVGRLDGEYAAYDPTPRFPVPVPLLILHGDEDDIVPLEHAQDVARRSGGELVVVPGAGHYDLYGLRAPAPEALFDFLAA